MNCKFNKTCGKYREDSLCCKNDKMARHYYGIHRPVGCYRSMSSQKEIDKNQKTYKQKEDIVMKQKINRS
jgi:hypothetical protein